MAGLVALGFSLSIVAFILVVGFERDRHQQEFESRAASRLAALQAEIISHIDAVHSLQSLYSATESVSRSDFGVFVQNEFPVHAAIQALEWIPLVLADERDSFEDSVQAEGFRDFKILERNNEDLLTTAAERPEYFPVTFIEPFSGNEAALGFDLASNDSRYAALREARDSGEPVASPRVMLVQEAENQYSFLVFIAIYKKGLPTSTMPERRESLQGFALGVFRVHDLVTSAWQNSGLQPLPENFELSLFDRSAPEATRSLLVMSPDLDAGLDGSGQLSFADSLEIGGRVWDATIITQEQPLMDIWQPWSALLAGLSLTMIASAYLLLAMQRESRTQLLVEVRTKELSETNQKLEDEITDRSRAQLELAGLYEISRIFSAEGDFQTKATHALEKVAVLLAADWVTLRLPKEEEPGLHLVAASGPAVVKFPPIPIFNDSMTMSAMAFNNGQIQVIDDYSARPSSSQALVNLGMRSMVILPIKAGERTMGLVTVISKDKNHFGPQLVHLLASVGEGLGVLLDNSLLHGETEKAHQALTEREARLRGIVDSAVDAIITIDEVGNVESYNTGAETIFGYAAAEVVGHNVNMLVPTPDHAAHDGYLNAYRQTGIMKVIGLGREVVGRRKDGSEFPLDLSVSVVELSDRKIYTGIIRDVTESKTLQREIEQRARELEIALTELKTLDRMKDEFISTVSHELRTPLTSIKGAAEILLNYQDEDPATNAEFLGIINNESDRLTRLINDVLDLARMESGQMGWDMSPVDLHDVIETDVDGTHALTVNKNVTVEVRSTDQLPSVESDTDKLVQVVANLLSNAIKFAPSGGLIKVRSRVSTTPSPISNGGMVEVSVSDNGVGIPASDIHKIFNRFQQAGSTLADRPQRTGLGLAISKEIVNHLGGDIWVESEPGLGSTFFFTIPSITTPV